MGSREVKVGLFVLLGFIASAVVIFLIGEERGLFDDRDEYHVVFKDVQGLKRGSPVRMGGVRIGTVVSVGYTNDASDPRPHVLLAIATAEAQRIREDSVAHVANKGFLGDKMIDISVGSQDKPPVPPGGTIKSNNEDALGEMFEKVSSLGDKAEGVMTNIEKTTEGLADPKFQENLKTGMKSLSGILESMDKGEGYAGKFLKDPEEAKKLSRTLTNLERSSASLNRLTRGLNKIVDRVNEGPGFAHEVVYGNAPNQALTNFGDAAGEVALTLRGIREGDGLAHGMLYGGAEKPQAVSDLSAITGDLRHIVRDMRKGKGTLGALLVDPSVYEDLKMLLGNVQRNQVLRALVRYSIQRDETQPRVQVVDPGPSKAPPQRAASGPSNRGKNSGAGTGKRTKKQAPGTRSSKTQD